MSKENKLVRYVAFLRGVNVGGKMVKMEELKKTFEGLGFKNAKTLLNSGNVIFETSETNSTTLTQKIEEKLEKTFGFHIDILLRFGTEIKSLVDANPFKNIKVTPQTRFYVTFLPEGEVCSTVDLSSNQGTTDLIKDLEKKHGKKITTRNWNTVLRIGKLLQTES